MLEKSRAINTLQEERDRAAQLCDQLDSIVAETAINTGETTVLALRSANWYQQQLQEQLVLARNRQNYLDEEVASKRVDIAKAHLKHSRAEEKAQQHARKLIREREDRLEADLPKTPRKTALRP